MAKAKVKHAGAVVRHTALAIQEVGDIVSLQANGVRVGIVLQPMAIGDVADIAISGAIEIDKNTATDAAAAGTACSISVGGQNVDVTPSANAVHMLAEDTANGDTRAVVIINDA